MRPLFTVATITYKSSNWVRQTINSVLASSFTDFEYIVADDCSPDDTWEVVQEFSDSRIRCWRNEQNIGEYANRNKVLHEARGKYILYIDGDDILYKDALLEYAKFASAFPTAGGIWGVHSIFFDFVAFPYLFTPEALSALNFLSTYPVTAVGFTDSVFKTEALLALGGFDESFAIGDTFMKRKFCCFYNVLLVPAGRSFWRQHPQQASNRVRFFYRNLIETFKIDKLLLESAFLPLDTNELAIAQMNFRIRTIKLIVLNTIRKGKIVDFFKLVIKLGIPFTDFFLLFKKGNYTYSAGGTPSAPLLNEYNLKVVHAVFPIQTLPENEENSVIAS